MLKEFDASVSEKDKDINAQIVFDKQADSDRIQILDEKDNKEALKTTEQLMKDKDQEDKNDEEEEKDGDKDRKMHIKSDSQIGLIQKIPTRNNRDQLIKSELTGAQNTS